MTSQAPEVWLRGAVPGIPLLLQPVAHSLLQCVEELRATLAGLTVAQIRARPGGAASIEFHVRHGAGSLDRLFTYARGEALSSEQRAALAAERDSDLRDDDAERLTQLFERAVQSALQQLRTTDEGSLLEVRRVGRAQLPSTVLGLLFHAAEHTQRHTGQAVTTAKIVAGAGSC